MVKRVINKMYPELPNGQINDFEYQRVLQNMNIENLKRSDVEIVLVSRS